MKVKPRRYAVYSYVCVCLVWVWHCLLYISCSKTEQFTVVLLRDLSSGKKLPFS